MKSKHIARAIILTVVLSGGPAMAQSAAQPPLSPNDKGTTAGRTKPGKQAASQPLSPETYVQRSGVTDLFEIQAGRIAEKRTKSQSVKEFAQLMIDDHGKALNDLKAAVRQAGLAVSAPDKLDAAHRKMIDRLNSEPDARFNAVYMEMQAQGHHDALALQKRYIDAGSNAALKHHAEKIKPVITFHLQKIEALTGTGDAAKTPKK